MDVAYLISSSFDYTKTLGPSFSTRFADDYGWQTCRIGDECSADVFIVDPRFDRDELPELLAYVEGSSASFVFRVHDPYWWHVDHWMYRFVSEMIDRPRCHVMLTYHPTEVTALFFGRARRSQFIFAPYVYQKDKELPINHWERSRVLIVSGATHPSIYPVRQRINRGVRLWPPLRRITEILDHPGYPDTGQRLRHKVVGDAYVKKLSEFKFAAFCSSRCRLEFLKYRECAYAGAVPVGDMPFTLLDCPADAWVPWRRNVIAITNTLTKMTDTAARAANFRRYLRDRRNLRDMRSMVTEQLTRL